MQRAEATIRNEIGLHGRPAAQFVQQAKQFNSMITISNRGQTANAKSLVHVLTLAITRDTTIEIVAEGNDEEQALAALIGLIDRNFIDPS